MGLNRDQKGFVLSGIALLLVLPAMLLAASCLKLIETGGESTSIQALSDKVIYTGWDVERMIDYMSRTRLPINDKILGELADNYRAATGLLVDIGPITQLGIPIYVRDPAGVAQYSSTIPRE